MVLVIHPYFPQKVLQTDRYGLQAISYMGRNIWDHLPKR